MKGKKRGSVKTGGRKKGSMNKATLEIKSLLMNNVNFPNVIQKLYELTQGVEVQVNTQSGVKVYTEKPDSFAAKILLEYMFGKPKQEINLGDVEKLTIVKRVINAR